MASVLKLMCTNSRILVPTAIVKLLRINEVGPTRRIKMKNPSASLTLKSLMILIPLAMLLDVESMKKRQKMRITAMRSVKVTSKPSRYPASSARIDVPNPTVQTRPPIYPKATSPSIILRMIRTGRLSPFNTDLHKSDKLSESTFLFQNM